MKAITAGAVGKAFNVSFAELYHQIAEQRVRPSCVYCADDAAREVTELIRDAGCEPVSAGGLENARLLEDQLDPLFAISDAGTGPFFYRIAPPGRL